MDHGKSFRVLTAGLALGLAAFAGASAARADEGGEGVGNRVEKRKVVIVKDGKPMVWEGGGPMVSRGYLGVGLLDLTPELRAHFGVPDDAGVMVSKVEAGSPAEKAGVKVGDILSGIDGKPVKSSWDVSAKVRTYDDGQQVPIEVWRNGKAQTVTASIVERERPEWDMAPLFRGENGDRLKLMGPGDWEKNWPKDFPKDLPRIERLDGDDGPQVRIQRRLSSPREVELEKKLKDLEKRIDELQKRLDKQR